MGGQAGSLTPKVVFQLLIVLVLVPFLPLLLSGQWDWWEAWAYALITILGFVISRVLAARRHPDLLAERARMMSHEDTEPWDRILAPLVGIGGALVPLVAGLDRRFAWPPDFGAVAELLALVVILAGYGLATYALVENRFFSGVVRIQTDRGHVVVSGGPYRWVRHPGYAGALLLYLATPFFLDSLWALVPALFLSAALVIRTRLEDATLQERLAGYREYAGWVRYRLAPGVW
jgi:protein-S-isoprenylcysteine O-methyltransferase Ste14